jgi:hypothetical protein
LEALFTSFTTITAMYTYPIIKTRKGGGRVTKLKGALIG